MPSTFSLPGGKQTPCLLWLSPGPWAGSSPAGAYPRQGIPLGIITAISGWVGIPSESLQTWGPRLLLPLSLPLQIWELMLVFWVIL